MHAADAHFLEASARELGRPMQNRIDRLDRVRGSPGRWLLGCLLVALSGCSAVFSAQVSRYEVWPERTTGESYWIAPEGDQVNNLQFDTYADTVRAALGPTGLVGAANRAAARFIVHLDYGSAPARVWRQQFVDPYFYPGFHRPWGPWGGGPMIESVPVEVARMSLTVRIDDMKQQGREVYRATARTDGRPDTLGAVMPYLARAVFDGFPGRNGEVIAVRYPLP